VKKQSSVGEAASYTNGVSAQTNELLPFQQRPRACDCPIQSFPLVLLQATFTSDFRSSQTFVCLRHTHMAPTVVKTCSRIAQSPCHTVSHSPKLSRLDGTDDAVGQSSIIICGELDAMSFPSSRLSPSFQSSSLYRKCCICEVLRCCAWPLSVWSLGLDIRRLEFSPRSFETCHLKSSAVSSR